ncbi:MAG TPA: phospholipase D-like domain-containing protein [Candidatus Eremiobacteraeota bacterium]|nr:MAG: putative cardiolipin synthase YwiE [bacterium ADurb.Bin363]HPZ10251.1 phospholipase D-like domain-containing protein [Candidatus Eremiobacteraeota bacterium]
MRKFFVISCVFLFVFISVSFVLAEDRQNDSIELVESVPEETIYDFPDIRNAREVWLDMINNAKKTLDIEVFYICNEKDEPLESVIEAIKEAGHRGVTVRIISDSRFYETYPETLDELGKVSNISVRIIPLVNLTDGVMHAKYFIVDGEEIFLGSQNFDWKALKHIREIGIRVKDKKIAETVEKIFNLDWLICVAKDKDEYMDKLSFREDLVNSQNPVTLDYKGEKVIIYPAFSPEGLIYEDMTRDEDAIVGLMNNAREEILIQVMNYSPVGRDKVFYPALDNAMRSAAVRGVKVKMIVANWSTKKPAIDFLKSLSLVPNIEIKISSIPEWSGGFVSFARVEHCKYMVVDGDKVWIGTSNWEKSYFYTCRNLSVVVQSKDFNSKLKKIFEKSWNGPYTEMIEPEKDYKPLEVKE